MSCNYSYARWATTASAAPVAHKAKAAETARGELDGGTKRLATRRRDGQGARQGHFDVGEYQRCNERTVALTRFRSRGCGGGEADQIKCVRGLGMEWPLIPALASRGELSPDGGTSRVNQLRRAWRLARANRAAAMLCVERLDDDNQRQCQCWGLGDPPVFPPAKGPGDPI